MVLLPSRWSCVHAEGWAILLETMECTMSERKKVQFWCDLETWELLQEIRCMQPDNTTDALKNAIRQRHRILIARENGGEVHVHYPNRRLVQIVIL